MIDGDDDDDVRLYHRHDHDGYDGPDQEAAEVYFSNGDELAYIGRVTRLWP